MTATLAGMIRQRYGFAYSPDRKGLHSQHHLRDFVGLLQTDAYAGFDAVAERAPRTPVQRGRTRGVLCRGHACRHFHDLQVAVGSPIALEALEPISELCGIERKIKGRTSQGRHRARQIDAVLRLQTLHAWLTRTLVKVPKSSELAKAIHARSRLRTGPRSRATVKMGARRSTI